MPTGKIRLGFVLLSNRRNPIASTRISVLNLLPYLNEAGFETHILFEPEEATETPVLSGVAERAVELGLDVVYFQKVHGPSVLQAVRDLSNRNIKTVFGVCDHVEESMAAATDMTVAVTEFLRSLYPADLQDRIFVVHDGIEDPDIRVRRYRADSGSRENPLNAVLVTSSELVTIPFIQRTPPWVRANVVGRYPPLPLFDRLRHVFWRLCEQPDARHRSRYLGNLLRYEFTKTNWRVDTVGDHLAAADIGIIPVETSEPAAPGTIVPDWQTKSENRLTLLMAAGLPVIASPVPSYEDVIVQGKNGFIARSLDDWRLCFQLLRDPDARETIGRAARETVLDRFSKPTQCDRLTHAIRAMLAKDMVHQQIM